MDKLHYLHFDVFLSPSSLRPRPAALGSSESSVVVFHVFYLISCVFRSRCCGTPSVTVTELHIHSFIRSGSITLRKNITYESKLV